MANVPQTPFIAPMLEVPDPPEEFGQDGGKFYRAYDALAEEIDEDMTKSLKEQLDGMLIFAGLFAGVNSAFLALTLPLLSADPADDTNALLAQNNAILLQLVSGRNDSASLEPTLPSKTFSPSGAILSVNILFSLSLAFAIISSFLAVVGRQWLVYYRKRSGGGPDRQRWEQLKRFLGAERWGLELILDDILPSLLQIGLIIFCVSLIIYLRTVNNTLSNVVGVPLYLALAFFVGSAICTIWDRFCPFHSPLSRFLQWILTSVPKAARNTVSWGYQKAAMAFGALMAFIPQAVRTWIRSRGRRLSRLFGRGPLSWMGPMLRRFNKSFRPSYRRTKHSLSQFFHARKEEDKESLQIIAVQRTICTSEDTGTLLHAAANIMAISNLDHLKLLWADEQFQKRLMALSHSSYEDAMQMHMQGREQFDFAASAARLYRSAETHVTLSISSSEFDPSSRQHTTYFIDEHNRSSFVVPGKRIASSSPLLILALSAFLFFNAFSAIGPEGNDQQVRELCDHLMDYCAASRGQHWRLLSLVSRIVSRLPDHQHWSYSSESELRSLKRSYLGIVDDALANFDLALKVLLDPKSKDLLNCDRMLLELLKCAIQIVGNRQPHPGVNLGHLIKILGTCEMALRSTTPLEDIKQAWEELRTGVKGAGIRLLPSENAQWANIPWDVLDRLGECFEQLLISERNQIFVQENMDVLQVFSPLMNQVFLLEPRLWEGVSRWRSIRWTNAPQALQEKRVLVCRTFNNLVSEVDKGFCQRHSKNETRRLRDPDAVWCCWRDERSSACIVSMYSLRPDPEYEYHSLSAPETN